MLNQSQLVTTNSHQSLTAAGALRMAPANTLMSTQFDARSKLPLSNNLRFFEEAVGGDAVSRDNDDWPGGPISRLLRAPLPHPREKWNTAQFSNRKSKTISPRIRASGAGSTGKY